MTCSDQSRTSDSTPKAPKAGDLILFDQSLLSMIPAKEPPPDFTERVLAAWKKETQHQAAWALPQPPPKMKHIYWRRLAWGLAATGAAMLSIAVYYLLTAHSASSEKYSQGQFQESAIVNQTKELSQPEDSPKKMEDRPTNNEKVMGLPKEKQKADASSSPQQSSDVLAQPHEVSLPKGAGESPTKTQEDRSSMDAQDGPNSKPGILVNLKELPVGSGPALDFEDIRPPAKFTPINPKMRANIRQMTEKLLELEGHRPERADLLFRLAENFYDEARAAQHAHKDNEASQWRQRSMDTLGQLLHEYPQYPSRDEIWYELATLLLEHKKTLEAHDAYLQIVKNHPKSKYYAEACLKIGEDYFQRSRFQEALAAFQNAPETPKDISDYSRYKVGWCYINLKELEKARECFEALAGSLRQPRKPFELRIKQEVENDLKWIDKQMSSRE